MRKGGKPKTFFGKLFKGIGDIGKGIADTTFSAIGANDLIQDSFVDRSKFLTGVTNTLGDIAPMVLNAFAPGAGTGVKFLGNTLNKLGQSQQVPQQQQQGFQFQQPQFGNFNSNMFGQLPTGSGGLGQQNNFLAQLLGQLSGGNQFQQPQFGLPTGTPFPATPGIAGPNLSSIFQPLMQFPEGGSIGDPVKGGPKDPKNNEDFGEFQQDLNIILSEEESGKGLAEIGAPNLAILGLSALDNVVTKSKTKGFKNASADRMLYNIWKKDGPKGLRNQLRQTGQGSLRKLTGNNGIGAQLKTMGLGIRSMFNFQEGGPVLGVPIQTEVDEVIVLPDGRIVDANAVKMHKQMDEDEVTDIAPEDSYILSNDKKIKMKKEDAEKLIMAVRSYQYREDRKARVPEEIGFDWLWGSDKKDKTPAELGQKIKQKFPTIDKKEIFGHSDIFTDDTNADNIESRLPWLEVAIGFNERERAKREPIPQFKHGGKARPFKMSHVRQAPLGGDTSDILNVVAQALPFLSNLFGGGQQNSSIDPQTQALALGALPVDQAAFQSNINARDSALGQATADFTGLGQNLNQFAGISAGAGIAGNLLQNTNLPRFDFSSARSRLNNFDTRTPRGLIEGLNLKRHDTRAILQEAGPRRGSTILSDLESNHRRNLNQILAGQFNTDRGLEFNKIQGLNQLDIGQQDRNIPLSLQEIQAQNAQTKGVFDQIGGLSNRLGSIQAGLQPILSGFNLERANLVGQPGMRAAQNMTNAASLLGSLQGPNQGQQGQGNNIFSNLFSPQEGGTGTGNFLRSIFGGARPTTVVDQLPTRDLGPAGTVNPLGAMGSQLFGKQCYDPKSGTFKPC
jgi:hypothetical protein